MKLNNQEKLAISALRNILDALENGKPIEITTAEQNAIVKVTGIDLKKITARKKDVKCFIKGKEDFNIIFRKPFSDWSEFNKVKSFGYFPFQIKERTVNGA